MFPYIFYFPFAHFYFCGIMDVEDVLETLVHAEYALFSVQSVSLKLGERLMVKEVI